MAIAKIEIDDAEIDEKIESRINAVIRKMPLWPPVMNTKQMISYVPFSGRRLYAVLFIYRNWLDEENGGCVYYPRPGQAYQFRRKDFDQWMYDHWIDIITIDMKEFEKDKVAYKASLI
ncbi:hypothetical protein [Companilactobacillus nantensis]|uniref:Uncharacterized protein n=1 Tax=Companilactobacillus nantensis DSM 16982 TaxID=1423774 RepID=A0A0R1WKV6_9LACO|nr:hypothetical protein [Companilactobacillus nantensis]KRM18439.1 hypothetical protein FD31_GL000986 [Companilactobacillus nantensis DSM 16982]GEO63009.1 hypothetical protein LNA01_01920 [Companilactobacillus nantensis]